MVKWEEIAEKLVRGLAGETDEQAIAHLCKAVIKQICDKYPMINSRKKPLATARKAVSEKFPATHEKAGEYQYFTSSGKGGKPRWEHLALKYLTFSEKDWDALGGDDRANWKATQQQIETNVVEPSTKNLTLADMNIDQLDLDSETRETVEQAIASSGMSLEELIKKSLLIYGKTVIGKSRKHEEDLSTIPTEELLKGKKYSTHPGRAAELTKRAIRAITIHNDEVATEKDQRWCVSQSAISRLISARASAIQEAMEPFKAMIDDHNAKHELTAHGNRKGRDKEGHPREIYREIDVCKLVPDGLA